MIKVECISDSLTSIDNIVSKLSDRVRQTSLQRRLILEENRWPPEQPKEFTPPLLIQYQGQNTSKEDGTLANLILGCNINDITSPINMITKYHPKLKEISSTKGTDFCHESLQTFFNNSTITKDVTSILSPFEKSDKPCFILIEGPPGIGKSLLLKEIAYRWGKNMILKTFKLVLLVCLRDPVLQDAKSIHEIFKFYCEGDIKATEIATACSDYFLNNGGIDLLFLFDGFDELPKEVQSDSLIRKILKRKVLPNCGLVVSSRPHVSAYLRTLAVYMVDILGFAEAERNDYIQNACKGQPNQIDELTTYLNCHATISSLCFVPFNMVVLLYLYKKGIKLPENFVDLYKYFICLTICHHIARYSGDTDIITDHDITTLPEPYNRTIKQLSKMSLEALNKQKLIFTIADIRKACPDILVTPGAINGFGLLQAVQSFGLTGATLKFNFIHYSVQEFLAAHYVAYLPQRDQLQALLEINQNSDILFFYIAIKGNKGFSGKLFLSGGNREKAISEEFLTDQLQCLRLYHSFCEIGEKEICTSIENANVFKHTKINLRHYRLTAHDVRCIALFIMSSFNKEWIELCLDSCYLQDHGLHFLHCIRGVTVTSLNLDNNGLTSSSSMIISDITNNCQVEWLSIAGNPTIGESNLLYSMLSSPSSMLKELYMQRTNLSSDAAKCLFAALKNTVTKLRVLNLMSNKIDDDASDVITSTIKINTSLTTLKLQRNPFSDESAFRILQALRVNNTIQVLGLPKYCKQIEVKIECLKEEVNQVRNQLEHPVTLTAITYS